MIKFPVNISVIIHHCQKVLFFGNLLILAGIALLSCREGAKGKDWEWREYHGGPDRNHYSPLEQINRENVHELEPAWAYHTGDSGQIQSNPIIVDGVMYGMTAGVLPFAVDASTGKEIWKMPKGERVQFSVSRGLAYWESGDDKRILYTNGEWLYAVNAQDGVPIGTFGTGGRVSLKSGLGPQATSKMVLSNTPGTIFGDLIIMPTRVAEDHHAALGHIQAFNVRTGELAWVFHTIPHPGEYGYDTWPKDAYLNQGTGGANNWAGMAVDRERKMLFVPTGSAAPDFYGKDRLGANLFANSLLALDAETGERIWHFQFVHHDILDMDLPAPPNLITLRRDGVQIDAVAQVTKHGYVYVFERESGEPFFPIEEVPVPASTIPGEEAWPTQPLPKIPVPFSRQTITPEDISPLAENRDELLEILLNSGYQGPFTPLNEAGMLVFPGLSGGALWGGAAVDREGVMYINANEMARYMGIGPSKKGTPIEGMSIGEQLYRRNCAVCHGEDLKGQKGSEYPPLLNINTRMEKGTAEMVLTQGKGLMPAFTGLSEGEREAILQFLWGEDSIESDEPGIGDHASRINEPDYVINRYSKFLDSKGYPAISPPWGTLNAIDLNSGEYRWKIPFGEYPELLEKGIPPTGSESFGGPLVTEGGILMIAGTADGKFRAFDKENGELLWEYLLPAPGFASASTYSVNGVQYVVIACGGTRMGTQKGDAYLAFKLNASDN